MSKRPRGNKGDAGDVAAKPDNDGDAGNIGSEDSSVAAAPAAIDPTTAIAGDTADTGPDSAPKRGRGRPPGSGNAAKTKPIPLNVTGLEKLLVGIHGGLAILSGRFEWSLDTTSRTFDGKTEAEFLAQSIADVARHYGGIADQKTLDWMNAIQCLAIVYGGRVYAIRATPRAKVAPKPDLSARPGHAPQHHITPSPVNTFDANADPANHGVGEIAGIGNVEFPDGHPLKAILN